MLKIGVIIQREYLTRVKKKSFLVTTLLVPLLTFGLVVLTIYLVTKSEKKERVAVWDETGFFINKLKNDKEKLEFSYIAKSSEDNYLQTIEKANADILVHIYPFRDGKLDSVVMFRKGSISLTAKEYIHEEINTLYRIKQLEDAGIDQSKIEAIHQSSFRIKSYDLEKNKESNTEIAAALGYVMGFLIYIVIFVYGAGVMRGVMEEKTNRIAEVIISSVRPFELMMGKIVGIALVGLTQFFLWGVLLFSLQLLIPLLVPDLSGSIQDSVNMPVNVADVAEQADNAVAISMLKGLFDQNWTLIIFSFLFYFLSGYLLYAAMFAAVGSLVNEDPQEAQQLTLPIAMPIILGMIIMMTSLKDPNSPIAVFGSIFPLTSSIVMMARIPFGVPIWQLLLSMSLLIAGFLLMTWLSAKIYRIGILMYGKKTNWKELVKWIRYG
jgi:ABC-type Na+ efflux pump, permease component